MKPVSKTAFYCCGVRMQDAESMSPIINDQFARRLLGEAGLEYWETFKQFKKPNAGNTARHYIIDQHLRRYFSQRPRAKVFLIGAGLDSRAYRLTAGNWFEVDEVSILAYKDQQLPIDECPNPLQRIPIDFSKENLLEKLLPYQTDEPVIVIIEGVILYLSDEELESTLQVLKACFPKHIILCDLMKKNFFNVFSKKIHKELVMSGTTFKDINNYPNRLFIEYGYQQRSIVSTAKEARRLNLVKLPNFLVFQLLGRFMMGYSVYEFVFGGCDFN